MRANPLVTAQSLRGYLNIFISSCESRQAFPNTLEIGIGQPSRSKIHPVSRQE